MSDFRSVDPTTGAVLAERPETTADEVERRLTSAARAAESWSDAPIADRAALLRGLAVGLTQGRDRYAALMAEELGKVVAEGRAEIDKCAHACAYAADRAAEWLAPELVRTEAEVSYVRFDPVGPVLAIMPWNFPFWQVLRFAASAWMAGNPVLLKPAPRVPRCAEAFALLVDSVGFPAGTFANLLVGVDRIEGLVADPRVAAVTFTGSARTGRAIAVAAGRHLKPTVLELGGSDPFLVLDDADPDLAARIGAEARLRNVGQSCIAAKRFLVHRSRIDGFLERVLALVDAQVLGDPCDERVTLGPLARADLRDVLHRQVVRSVELGATQLRGGQIPDGPGFFYPPTVLTDCGPGMPVWDEETFGPVFAVRTFESDDEAVVLANTHAYGLGATVITADRGRAEALARRIRCGSFAANAVVRSDPRLPFGGTGASGWGRELGREGMRAFTHAKSVWIAG